MKKMLLFIAFPNKKPLFLFNPMATIRNVNMKTAPFSLFLS